MIPLAFLLVGGRALRRRWWVLLVLALVLIGLAALILADLVDGVVSVTTEVFGLVFLVEGAFGLFSAFARQDRAGRTFTLVRAGLLIVIGCLILDFPVSNELAVAALFSAAFAADGLARILSAAAVRFARWGTMVAVGLAELLFAAFILAEWPLPHGLNIPICISLFLLVSGWAILRASLMLRSHLDEVAILALPLFGRRSWYDNAPVLVDGGGSAEAPRPAMSREPLTVHVWTPVGSADVRGRRPLIDRYIAAVDAEGHISTGHSALELKPDVYISHYPAVEIEHSAGDFTQILRASIENNVKGRFQPSYAHEAANWCPADQRVEFFSYDARRLRAYWAGYRQDDTYNLTNRNCSVAVVAGLDSALEGALATRTPWLRLAALLLNPDLWAAAFIRSRAEAMCWTPGLVLDYARTLKRIIEPTAPSWLARLADYVRRLRARDRIAPQEPGP